MYGLCFEEMIDEGEVGVIVDDFVDPYGFDGAHEWMFLPDVVVVEERVGFSDQVEQIISPSLLKLGELDHPANTRVDDGLDLGIDILFELVLQQDDQHFKHMPAL